MTTKSIDLTGFQVENFDFGKHTTKINTGQVLATIIEPILMR